MTALALFPARIRWVNADGTLTTEAYRALQAVQKAIGGNLGSVGTDTYSVDTFAQSEAANLADMLFQSGGGEYLAHYEFQDASGGFLSDQTFQV